MKYDDADDTQGRLGKARPVLNPNTQVDIEDATLKRSDIATPAQRMFGNIHIGQQQPIILQIGNHNVLLPMKATVIIGRHSQVAGEVQPDVDLGEFETGKKTISRQHLCIRRGDTLVYLSDMYSTNGTKLNGQRLLASSIRVLRDGDELQLGDLKVKVRFSF